MNAVEIDGLTYTYPGAPQPTLKEISLQIEKGDFLAVVGNNGCGKSTLCKALNGLIPHFITGTMEGSVRVEGLDTRESDVGVLAQKVGYVYQDFENQIVRPTVLDDASYACLNYAFPTTWRGAGLLCGSAVWRAGRRNMSGSSPAVRPTCWPWPARCPSSRTF